MSGRVHLPRGLVTFLFTDIEGSTRLAQMLGAGYRPVLTEHRQLLRTALSANSGIPLCSEGDSLFVAFPDAAAALLACACAQRALAGHQWPAPQARPRVRMGLHTGRAHPYAGEYASPEVHRAARIAAAAHGGQVLCSAATARAAGTLPDRTRLLDLGLHRLRGFDGRERLYQLVAPGLVRRFPRVRTVAAPHNLPAPVTSFVGRHAEQADLAVAVRRHRLVTVVGPAGAGKTRLAVRVAAGLVGEHPDGVWYVDLAAVTDAALVPAAIGAGLGLRPEPGRPMTDTLADFVAPRRMLLVLDTCDAQPATTAAVLGRLLTAGPGVRVLATSREPLRVAGEVVWRIPPLSLEPEPDGEPGDAVRLLLDRVASATGGRHPVPSDVEDLTRVARRLEGLPLALELAAARTRVLSANELATRLDDATAADVVSIVDGPDPGPPGTESSTVEHDRHATLHASVTWSYRTLRPGPAQLLRWLSVFAGPVDLATVAWLAGEDPLAQLTVLVDKSLVRAEPSAGATGYRMPTPIRGYAGRRLAEAGEETSVRNRHLAWTLHALAAVHHGPDGRPATLNLAGFDPLAGEVRAALRWATSGGSAGQGLRVAVTLDQWWRERGLAAEGRRWLSRLYQRAAAATERIADADLALAYQVHAMNAGVIGDHAEELRFLERAEAAAARAGDPRLLVRVRAGAGMPLADLGDLASAERTCRAVLASARQHDALPDALFAIYCLAQLLWRRRELDEAAELLAAARPAEAARPTHRGRRTVDMILGMVALARGDLVAAHDHLTVALRSRMAHGFHARAVQTVSGFAVRCALGGESHTAATLFGAAEAARTRLHAQPGGYGGYWAQQQNRLRAVLGDTAFDTAYAQGSTMPLESAAALALSVEHPDLAADSARFTHADSPTP